MIPNHFNSNGLPPISTNIWLWIKTIDGELRKVRRTEIIHDKYSWEWPCATIEGHHQVFKVKAWAYT